MRTTPLSLANHVRSTGDSRGHRPNFRTCNVSCSLCTWSSASSEGHKNIRGQPVPPFREFPSPKSDVDSKCVSWLPHTYTLGLVIERRVAVISRSCKRGMNHIVSWFARQNAVTQLRETACKTHLAGLQAAAGDCVRILMSERNWISILYRTYTSS